MRAKSDKPDILPLVAHDRPAQEDRSAERRILRLSPFLFEANRLRNRSERTLPEQAFVIPLTPLVEP